MEFLTFKPASQVQFIDVMFAVCALFEA